MCRKTTEASGCAGRTSCIVWERSECATRGAAFGQHASAVEVCSCHSKSSDLDAVTNALFCAILCSVLFSASNINVQTAVFWAASVLTAGAPSCRTRNRVHQQTTTTAMVDGSFGLP